MSRHYIYLPHGKHIALVSPIPRFTCSQPVASVLCSSVPLSIRRSPAAAPDIWVHPKNIASAINQTQIPLNVLDVTVPSNKIPYSIYISSFELYSISFMSINRVHPVYLFFLSTESPQSATRSSQRPLSILVIRISRCYCEMQVLPAADAHQQIAP